MRKKQKIKYLLAIYTIVASMAVILWLLAYFASNQIVQATLLNLATELFGVVFIFFIVNYLFSLDDWETAERVDRLLDKLEESDTKKASDFFIKKPDIEDLIHNSTHIDLCGVALGTTIDSNLSQFRDAIRNGAIIRVLIMEGADNALDIAANRSETSDRRYYEKKLESANHNLEYLRDNSSEGSSDFKGIIQVGYLPYPPSFGMSFFRNENEERECIVEMYAHHVGWGEPPIFLLDSDADSEWYAYFQTQFDTMWQIFYKPHGTETSVDEDHG